MERRIARIVKAALIAAVILIALPYAVMPLYRAGEPISTLMLARWLTGGTVTRQWVPLERMGRAVPLAVIVAEDAKFCSHRGIDWGALQNAIEDAQDGEASGGGSTITQQTVKNLFLWQGRSYIRKALEIPLALWMEMVLSKRRIMELYLNIAEWGPGGEFGAESGAIYAFGRGAAQLSGYQAGALAAVLPNPMVRNARRQGPGMRRLGGTYAARMAAAPQADDCL